jgi:hypothetical protein
MRVPIWKALLLGCCLAFAVSVTPASAQVEITDEASTDHCPPVSMVGTTVTGGCPMKIESQGNIVTEAFGVPVAICEESFEARVDEDGNGIAYDQDFNGANCPIEPCSSGGSTLAWPFAVIAVGAVLYVLFSPRRACGPMGQTECSFAAELTPHSHDSLEVVADEAECEENELLHVTGSWEIASDMEHPAFEIALLAP